MTTRSRKLPGAGSIVFAPPAAENHPLKVAQFRAWRVKEPVSNRRCTVVTATVGPNEQSWAVSLRKGHTNAPHLTVPGHVRPYGLGTAGSENLLHVTNRL